jgi:hypothetical protein
MSEDDEILGFKFEIVSLFKKGFFPKNRSKEKLLFQDQMPQKIR